MHFHFPGFRLGLLPCLIMTPGISTSMKWRCSPGHATEQVSVWLTDLKKRGWLWRLHPPPSLNFERWTKNVSKRRGKKRKYKREIQLYNTLLFEWCDFTCKHAILFRKYHINPPLWKCSGSMFALSHKYGRQLFRTNCTNT